MIWKLFRTFIMLKYAINQMENYVRIFDEMGTYLDF